MISILEIEHIIFDFLNVPSLTTLITGDVYLSDDRPLNSGLEDVEINTIAMTQEPYPQEGVMNLNIYVPDMAVSIGGVNQYKSNKNRLQAIIEVVKGLINEQSNKNLALTITNELLISEKSIRQSFINLRIEFIYYETERKI